MANLDTREKRASSVAISLYPMAPSVQAGSAGLDDEDRQIAGYGYSAISAAAAPTTRASRLTLVGVS